MKQQIFEPKYPTKMYSLILFIPMAAFFLWKLVAGKDTSTENIFATIFSVLILALAPYALVKRIVFDANAFSIEKYIWPTNTIAYADVIDIGLTVIKTRSGRIGIGAMVNADELHNIFGELIEQGKINRYQIENKIVVEENISRKALLPAVITSSVLWVVIMPFIWPYEESFFRGLSFFAFFIPIYIVVYWFLKSRSDNQ